MNWTRLIINIGIGILILYLYRIYICWRVIDLFTALYGIKFPYQYIDSNKIISDVETKLKSTKDLKLKTTHLEVYLPLSLQDDFRDKIFELADKYEFEVEIEESKYTATAIYKFINYGI